jgi:arsenate reductase
VKQKVLFICTHNSARSQIAEAWLNTLYGKYYEAESAGITPTTINPRVVQVMAEVEIDVSTQRSKSITEFYGKNFDYVVTVCDHAQETCPFFPGKKIVHHSFSDPSQAKGNEREILDTVRTIRDTIKKWIVKTFKPKTS